MTQQGVETGDVSECMLWKMARLTQWVGYNSPVVVDEEWKRKWARDARVYKLRCYWMSDVKSGGAS